MPHVRNMSQPERVLRAPKRETHMHRRRARTIKPQTRRHPHKYLRCFNAPARANDVMLRTPDPPPRLHHHQQQQTILWKFFGEGCHEQLAGASPAQQAALNTRTCHPNGLRSAQAAVQAADARLAPGPVCDAQAPTPCRPPRPKWPTLRRHAACPPTVARPRAALRNAAPPPTARGSWAHYAPCCKAVQHAARAPATLAEQPGAACMQHPAHPRPHLLLKL